MNLHVMNRLLGLPCVIDRRVIVDIRGPYPTMIRGLKAATVETFDDVIQFITYALD